MAAQQIAVRRDTTANWLAANPVLGEGEPALNVSTGDLRFGNGVDAWNILPAHHPGQPTEPVPPTFVGRLDLTGFYDVTNPPADFTDAIQDMIVEANGRPCGITLPGDYPCNVSIIDFPVDFKTADSAHLLQILGAPAFTVKQTIQKGFSAVHAKAFIGWFSSHKAYEKLSTFTVAQAELATIKINDVLFYSTTEFFRAKNATTLDDTDAADFLSINSTTSKSFDAGYVSVRGFAVNFTGGADIANADVALAMVARDAINNKIVRSSSGGQGLIMSSTKTPTGTKVLVLKTISGTFNPGDILTTFSNQAAIDAGTSGTAAGTVAAAPAILMAGALLTNPGSSLLLHRKQQDIHTKLSVTVKTLGDFNRVIGDKNLRDPAIDLIGVLRPLVSARVEGSYAAGVRLRSTFRAELPLIRVTQVGNNAYDTEQDFGYGVLETGCSEGTVIGYLACTNVRHGYTTGIQSIPSYPVASASAPDPAADPDFLMALLSTGAVKHSHLVAYDIRHSYAAGVDLHGGAFFVRIGKGTVSMAASAGSRETESYGFQDRGFGTNVDGMVITGVTEGMNIMSHRYPSPVPYVNRYSNITIQNHTRNGVKMTNTAAVVSNGTLSAGATTAATWDGRFEFDNVRTIADREVHTLGTNNGRDVHSQNGFDLAAPGVKVTVMNCHVSGFNGAALLVESPPAELAVMNFTQDLRDSPSGTSPIRFEVLPTGIAKIVGLRTFRGANALGGQIRTQAANLNFDYHDVVCVDDPAVPLMNTSGTGNAYATAVPRKLTVA